MARLGDVDLALKYLEAGFELGGAALIPWAKEDSDLDPLRDDPRFQAIMAAAESRPSAKS
jgi:hypothetical protein